MVRAPTHALRTHLATMALHLIGFPSVLMVLVCCCLVDDGNNLFVAVVVVGKCLVCRRGGI